MNANMGAAAQGFGVLVVLRDAQRDSAIGAAKIIDARTPTLGERGEGQWRIVERGRVRTGRDAPWRGRETAPPGWSRPHRALLFSGELAQVRQPGSSDPRGRRHIKNTLIHTNTLNEGWRAVGSPAGGLAILHTPAPPLPAGQRPALRKYRMPFEL